MDSKGSDENGKGGERKERQGDAVEDIPSRSKSKVPFVPPEPASPALRRISLSVRLALSAAEWASLLRTWSSSAWRGLRGVTGSSTAQSSANFTAVQPVAKDSPQLPASSSSPDQPLSSSLSSINFEGTTVSSSNERPSSSLISGEYNVPGTFPLSTRLLNGLVLVKLALIFPLESSIRLPGVTWPGGVCAHDPLTRFSTICPSHG